MAKLGDDLPGDPIENHRVLYTYSWIQILLENRGPPTGRFSNDIASLTLQGLAEWTTKNDHFRDMTVAVYYDRYFVGAAEIKLLQSTREAKSASATLKSVSLTYSTS